MCGVLLYLLGGPEKGIIPREIIPKLPSLQSKVEGILKEESRQRKLSEDSNPFPPEPKGKSLKKESKQPKSADSAPSSLELRGMSQESPTPKEVRDHGRNGKDEPLWEEWERRALEVSPTPKSEVREPLSTWEEEIRAIEEGNISFFLISQFFINFSIYISCLTFFLQLF